MERSWQTKCSSAWQALPPSSSEFPQQGSQNQVEMNADKIFHSYATQELHSLDDRTAREPMSFNTSKSGSYRSGKLELGNSFLALLSGPSSHIQREVQQVSSSESLIPFGKLSMHGNSTVFNGERCGVPCAADGLLSQHQGSSGIGNGAVNCPVSLSRAASTSTRSRVSVLHDIQMKTLTRSDMKKSALWPLIQGSGTGTYLSSSRCSWLPTRVGQHNATNNESSLKAPSVTKFADPDSSAFVRGHLRVFCLATSGDLLISTTGLIGIVCSCHGLQMSISKFCEHSGLCAANPGNAVRLESGETVAQWRRLYCLKSGIRIPDDNSGWDWPEKVPAAGGSLKCNDTMQNISKNSGMFQLPDPSVASARQQWNNLGLPNNSSARESILKKTFSQVIHNSRQRNPPKGNAPHKNLVATVHNILPSLLDVQTMHTVKDTSVSGVSALLQSPSEHSQNDSGYQSISDYIDFLTKRGNPISNQSLVKLKVHGTDFDVNRGSNSRQASVMETNAISSNIELRLGQPSQKSHTLGGSVIPATQPQPFNVLSNCQKSQLQDPVFHCFNPRVTEEPRQNHWRPPSGTSCSKRQSESQLNLMHVTSRSHSVTEPLKMEHYKADIVGSSPISMVLSHLITSETNVQSWATGNMVSYNEPFMSRVLNGESRSANGLPGVRRSRNGGMELDINELGHLNLVDKGKGAQHIAGSDSYVAPKSNSLFHNTQMDGPSPFNGVVNGNCLPSPATMHERQCYYRGQSSYIPEDASAINLSSQLGDLSCPGSSVHKDHAFLRSINSSTNITGTSLPLSAVTSNKECIDVSPHFLDENLRLLALRHIVHSSKQENTIAYREMDTKQHSVYSPSTVEVQRRGSTLSPLACEQQKEQPHLTTKQDASVFSVTQFHTSPQRYMNHATEKLPYVAGVNSWCNFSTPSQGISFDAKEDYIPHPPHDLHTDKQPFLRLGRTENCIIAPVEHGTCSQNETGSDFSRKRNCAVHSISFAGNSVSRSQAPVNACKTHADRISADTSNRVASVFDNRFVVLGDKTTVLGHCENLNIQTPAQNGCHASQWRDVPSKKIGVCNAIGTEKPADVLDAKAIIEDKFVGTTSKVVNRTEEAETLNEQQMSNVCSGFSAPAVTEVTVEFNDRDSCTGESGDPSYSNDHVVDEESGIEKCCSSNDALESERSTGTVNTSRKLDLMEGGSSSGLPMISSHRFPNNLRFSNAFEMKKLEKQLTAVSSVQGSTKHKQQLKSELRNGKRKKVTKWKSLDAFPISGLPSLCCDSPRDTDHTELLPCSLMETQTPSQANHGLQRNMYDVESSALKRKRSAFCSTKTLSWKKVSHGLDDHPQEWEGDCQSLSNDDINYQKKPKLSSEKKLKRCWTLGLSRQLHEQETDQVGVGKTAKYYNSAGVKNISRNKLGTCCKKARPVVCGKSGIISNGNLTGGEVKPAKIVSVSIILKTAKKCYTETEEPRLTATLETNIACFSRSTECNDSPSASEGGRANTKYETVLKNEEKAGTSTSEIKKACFSTNETCFSRCNRFDDKPSVSYQNRENAKDITVSINGNKTGTSSSEIKKACVSRKRALAAELSRLETENVGDRRLNHKMVHMYSSAPLKSRFKEARKRSLWELEGKGKVLISEMSHFKETSKLRTKFRSLGKSYTKKVGLSKCRRGELYQVSTKRSVNERKCQAFVLDLEAFCCVCGSSNKDEVNCLLECSSCSIRVHQACYGVSRVPKGRWCCRPCKENSKNTVCVLCGYESGAMTGALKSRYIVKSLLEIWNVTKESMSTISALPNTLRDELALSDSSSSGKRASMILVTRPEADQSPAALSMRSSQNETDDKKASNGLHSSIQAHNTITAGILDPTIKQWVHMVCGLWTPETRCPNVDTMSAFDVSGVPIPAKDLVCSLCNRPGGSCIQCRVVNCYVHFHPWCAHQKGLLQSEVEGIDNDKVGFYGRCMLHTTYHGCNSDVHPFGSNLDTLERQEYSCARTEGFKGCKRDGFRHNLSGLFDDGSGCLVPQEQINAWLHINRQKPCTRVLVKPLASDVEYDCRKEYARYKLTKGWKHLVVYKSGIHGLGLYTSQFIRCGAMVVEYVGEIVGLRVADKREVEYQSGKKLPYKGACYFFRINKEHIIDATRKGGIARFVNHSCLPNCVAKIISVRSEKKLVFFAERDINPGEEITYDYHFNHEDEGMKIPCFCSSKNCRRYLN